MSHQNSAAENNATTAPEAAQPLAWVKNTHFLDKYNMTGRTAVVTGGGSGIGLSSAAALCSVGAHVIIAGRNEEKLRTAVAGLQQNNGSAEYVAFDVSDPAAIREAAKAIGNKHGKIHVLVNNAGVAQSSVPAEVVSDEIFDKVLKTNLYGVHWCIQAFLPYMKGCHPSASIVNVGSISGNVAHRPLQQAAYNASKAGLHHYSSSVAIELTKDNIRVNTVAPGLIQTDMTKGAFVGDKRKFWMDMIPMQRMAQPDEVAHAILHLATDASSYVTGTVWLVDGGYCAL